jgi:hypothetical protein
MICTTHPLLACDKILKDGMGGANQGSWQSTKTYNTYQFLHMFIVTW